LKLWCRLLTKQDTTSTQTEQNCSIVLWIGRVTWLIDQMPFSDRCIRHLSSQYAGYICLTMVDWPMATGLHPLTVMIQSPLILRFYWHKILWFDTADISNSDWYLVIFLLINWYILSRRPRVCLGLSCIAVTNDIMTLEIELFPWLVVYSCY